MFIEEVREKREERIAEALKIAWQYGQVDGAEHKMWVIDQMVRTLCCNDIEYTRWVRAYENPTFDYKCYKWNTGIAPEIVE